jgi:hypothetical protein
MRFGLQPISAEPIPWRDKMRRGTMKSYLKQYIDGAWVDSEGGTVYQVIDRRRRQGGRRRPLGIRELEPD